MIREYNSPKNVNNKINDSIVFERMEKKIKIIFSVVIIVIIVLAVFILFTILNTSKSEESKFYDHWIVENEYDYYTNEIIFFKNGSLKQIETYDYDDDEFDQVKTRWETWKLKDGKVEIIWNVDNESFRTIQQYNYKFTNNDQTLTLYTSNNDEPVIIWLHRK